MAANGADDELRLDYKLKGGAGKGVLRAMLAGQSFHTATVDLADPDAREKFLEALCKKRPGIDRLATERTLEDLAGGCIDETGDSAARRSQADVLVELAAEAELFNDGEPGHPAHRPTSPTQSAARRGRAAG